MTSVSRRLLLTILAVIGTSTTATVFAQETAPPADRAQWTAAIRQAFSTNKPNLEAIRGVSGQLRPELTIVIEPDGAVSDVTVKRSSGFPPADEAAVAMIRNAARLPAFTADMPKNSLSFVLPVAMSFAPTEENDLRLYIDTAAGMRLEVPAPLVVRSAAPDPRFDLVVEVQTGQEPAPYAQAEEPLCVVGFRKAPAAAPSEADAQRRVEAARDEMVGQSSAKGLEAERSEITDYRSTRLIELQLKPKPGAEPSDRRYVTSSFELPGGGFTLFCAADEKAMPDALAAFRSIRDGANALPK